MLVSPIIQLLRKKLTAFGNRVGGVSEYELLTDDSRLTLPALYVLYDGSTATTKFDQNELDQEFDERVQIIAVLDNTDDRTGKKAQDQIHAIRLGLLSQLFNYRTDDSYQGLQYVSDRPLQSSRARYLHLFEFKKISRYTSTVDPQAALEDFTKFYADWNLKDTSADVHPDAQDRDLIPII